MSFAKYLPLLLVVTACAPKPPSPKSAEAPAIRVTTVAAETTRLASERILSGTVTARTTGSVSARLPGHVREVRVREGDLVQAGQVLAVIDARDADAAIKQAEAGRDEARAALPEADASVAAATSQADFAKATFRRMQELRASKSITEQEFDEAQARMRLAESQIQMAQARRFQVRERIRQADEAVDRAKLQQSYATVTAPFAGVVLERKAEPGTFANPGMPIAVLERAGEYRFEVPVEESLLPSLKVGQKVTVELEGAQELAIGEILPSVDAQSRTATIRIPLPGRGGLRSGMSGRIRLHGEDRDAVTIPKTAVRANGQLQTVFVVAGDRARAVLVSVGEARDGRAEVFSGLSGGDRVIAAPPAALADGARIEVAQ